MFNYYFVHRHRFGTTTSLPVQAVDVFGEVIDRALGKFLVIILVSKLSNRSHDEKIVHFAIVFCSVVFGSESAKRKTYTNTSLFRFLNLNSILNLLKLHFSISHLIIFIKKGHVCSMLVEFLLSHFSTTILCVDIYHLHLLFFIINLLYNLLITILLFTF